MSYIEKKVEWIGHFYCIGGILCFIKYHIRSTVWTILSCFILAGGIFVRWGRKDCSGNNTELIYSGKHLDCICLLRGAEKAHRCVAKYLKQRIGANNNLHTIASGEHRNLQKLRRRAVITYNMLLGVHNFTRRTAAL